MSTPLARFIELVRAAKAKLDAEQQQQEKGPATPKAQPASAPAPVRSSSRKERVTAQ